MNPTGRFAVILPAAGKSSRFGGVEKKAFLPLAGTAVWLHSARRFARHPDVRQIIVVLSQEDRISFERRFGQEISAFRIDIAIGGNERFESVANALALVPDDIEFVAVHDAARPCLTNDMIDKVFQVGVATGAAILAVPIGDTVKRADGAGRVVETVSRRGLWLAQTPQVFRRDWLTAAYADRTRLGSSITDDAQLMEAAGHGTHLVPGSATNLKITTSDDFPLAEAILEVREPR